MKRFFLIILAVLLTSCSTVEIPTQALPTDTPQASLPNPASVFCEEQGYKVEIRTATDGSQSGLCIFSDGSACDEWAYFRGECTPASTPTVDVATPVTASTEISTPLPIDPAGYQGWWTYTHPNYAFSIKLPEDWIVEETITSDPLMNGHLLMLRPKEATPGLSLRMTFRRIGEEVLLWPTGVGQGEFIPQGTLDIAGQPAQRLLLVCPTGEVTSIWYHQGEGEANIRRGDLEFAIIFNSNPSHCEVGYTLSGKIQLVGEMIIASLTVP